MHSLSESDLSWIYSTRNSRGSSTTAEDRAARKSAWMAIAQALPHRTPKSVWAFATRALHEGNHLVCTRMLQCQLSFSGAMSVMTMQPACGSYRDLQDSSAVLRSENLAKCGYAGQVADGGCGALAGAAC